MPVPGDEDYVDGDFTICREPNAPPVQSLSAIMRAQSIAFATPSVPSLYTSTNPARSGASASAAAPQFRLSSLLLSAPAAAPSLRTAAPTLLSIPLQNVQHRSHLAEYQHLGKENFSSRS